MLTKLNIQNYALIDDASVSFTNGLTTITGETGAGKSILLGGLGLILGNRADTQAMMNPKKKCVIEGEFDISKYHLQNFFLENDLDYEPLTFIRRELLPGGKSRAFVNDTPVRLEILSELQSRLIDVHSQHQTLQINETNFQYQVLDAVSDSLEIVNLFQKNKNQYETKVKELENFLSQIEKEKEQADYHYHLFQELESANVKSGELEILEQEQERLSHIELIQSNLLESYKLISEEDFGIHARLYQVKSYLEKIKNYSKTYEEMFQRVESTYIELNDLNAELSQMLENEDYSTDELEKVNSRLQLIYNLLQKHRVQTLDELIEIFQDLAEKVKRVTDSDEILKQKQQELTVLKNALTDLGKQIHEKREKSIPFLQDEITGLLHNLGMNEAVFKIQLETLDKFNSHGINNLQWLFSANKGNKPGLLRQVASGGEMSRIMLAIKSVLAKKSNLPTIIFDEIDTGISGEIALKMSEIMRNMAKDMQVICITHLPQIAAKGEQQLKVYKEIQSEKTNTKIKKLSPDERLQEIAEMLGGKQLTETARNHAAELLQLKK